MSGPDELEMCAAVKLAATVPLTAAMEALKSKVVGSKQDKTITLYVCCSSFNQNVSLILTKIAQRVIYAWLVIVCESM